MQLLIPVSWGELFDKITILDIKSVKIKDSTKLANINKELDLLTGIVGQCLAQRHDSLNQLIGELRVVNETLWNIEDEIRDCERQREFGLRFVELARAVYKTNDRRAALKLAINKYLGSELIEEKSYQDY